MLIKKAPDLPSSEITSRDLVLNRRKFLTGAALAGAATLSGFGVKELLAPSLHARAGQKIDGIQKSSFSTTEKVTPYNDVTHYNNYYEFSTEKEEPASLAKDFKTRPWTVKIDGAHMEEAIAFVKDTWDKMITTYPFDYSFLDSHLSCFTDRTSK